MAPSLHPCHSLIGVIVSPEAESEDARARHSRDNGTMNEGSPRARMERAAYVCGRGQIVMEAGSPICMHLRREQGIKARTWLKLPQEKHVMVK